MPDEIGCTCIMWRGRITGNVLTCGVCEWCRAHDPEAEAGDTGA